MFLIAFFFSSFLLTVAANLGQVFSPHWNIKYEQFIVVLVFFLLNVFLS